MSLIGLVAMIGFVPTLVWAWAGWKPGGTASDWRRAVLAAFITGGVAVVGITEIFSAFNRLEPKPIAVCWMVLEGLVFGFGAVGWFFRLRSGGFPKLERFRRFPSRGAVIFWGAVFLWLTALLVLGLASPSNNHDSLTYRLPRVMHWAQNQSVEFFATENLRQNHRAPFSEFTLLQLFLLTKNDTLFNLVQWLSLIGCLIAVWELTVAFGASPAACRVATVLVLTTPMAVLQATSTQSDLVASLYFLAFLVFGLRLAKGNPRIANAMLCGAALGLALLTRSTIFLYAGLFVIGIAALSIRAIGWRAVPLGAVCGLVAGLLMAGHSVRNWQAFSHPLGLHGEPPWRGSADEGKNLIAVTDANARMGPREFASNLVRNAAMHAQTPVHNFNLFVLESVYWFHQRIGMSLNDPDLTWPGASLDISYLRHEDIAGNPLQALLFCAATGTLIFGRKEKRKYLWYALGLWAGFLGLSYLVRWEPWHPRLELPLFLAASPLIAMALPLDRTRWGAAILGMAALYATPFLIDNDRRPFFGPRSVFINSRGSNFFPGNFERTDEYRDVVKLIKTNGYRVVGLELGTDTIQYPLWAMLRARTPKPAVFHEVNVTNLSRDFSPDPPPEAVVVLHPAQPGHLQVGPARYVRIWQGRELAVYQRESGS